MIKLKDFTQDEVERILGEMDARVRKASSSGGGSLPTSAPRTPKPGMAWLDVESGKIKFWTGAAWVSFTKDV